MKCLYYLKIPTRRLCKLHKRLQMPTIPQSLPEALKCQNLARKEYRKIKKRSQCLRATFREDLASAIALHKGISVSSALREFVNREEAREMHRRIKWVRKKYNCQSTSGVLISTSRGSKTLVTDKSSLEAAIIHENESKFHQTEGKYPLTKGTLLLDIGLCGTGPKSTEILAGTYTPPPMTAQATISFLNACKKPDHFTPSQFDHLSKEQYIRAWSRARENTGSGRIHFGHWKAGVQDYDIATAEWQLTMIPAKYGFSPSIWPTATDVMILKKEGILDIDKLRTIVLYEADFNFFNKCIGRQAMDNAMQNGNMASEQYAKPKSSAQEQCITRRLIFDIVRHTRQTLAMASSDLKSCYDRIVHSAAAFALQKNGISQEAVTTMFTTIQQCQHHIRTAYGDSEISYGGTGSYTLPPMGAGQGNGAGPQMWAVLSSVLFLAMHMEGLSTPFCQKITKQILSLVGFMYVDDMDLIHLRDDLDAELITEDLQLALQYWNKLVKVTGGALEPNKSGWYAYGQQWDPIMGRYRPHDLGSTGDKDGHIVSLPFISCHSSQEMIGVKLTPTGNYSNQLNTMLDKAMEEVNLSPVDMMQAIKTSVLPRISWPLTCMSISKEDGKRILRPVLKSALPKLGIVSTLGYDFIHGSPESQGLGIPELYHLTYAKQVEILVDHLWKSSETGHFIQMAIQEFIIKTGTFHQPFATPKQSRLTQRLSTEHTWIGALHRYSKEHNIILSLPLPTIAVHRKNDASLMDTLDGLPFLSSHDLKDTNVCRLYKKVFFLSDIFSGDGSTLSAFAWNDTVHSKASAIPFNRQDFPTQ